MLLINKLDTDSKGFGHTIESNCFIGFQELGIEDYSIFSNEVFTMDTQIDIIL